MFSLYSHGWEGQQFQLTRWSFLVLGNTAIFLTTSLGSTIFRWPDLLQSSFELRGLLQSHAQLLDSPNQLSVLFRHFPCVKIERERVTLPL